MIVLGGLWVIQLIIHVGVGFNQFSYRALVLDPLALRADRLARGEVWRAFSYMFLHSVTGIGHIIFNFLSLYFFGPPLEQRFGRNRFLTTFVTCGIGGAIAVLLVYLVAWFGFSFNTSTYTLGASGAVTGIVAAMCWLWKDRYLNLFFFEAKGWHLLAAFVVLDILRAMTGQPIAVVVHFGGMATGIAIASGFGPYAGYQKFKLWRMRGKLKEITGGKDMDDLIH
jgi:membrane associated rhomboid family serine protease